MTDAESIRLQERDAEYQHRLLELELAADGLAPVGADPRATSHGANAFVEQMRGVDVDAIGPVIAEVHDQGYSIVPDFLDLSEVESLRTGLSGFFTATEQLFESPNSQLNVFEGRQAIHIQNILGKTDLVDSIATKQNLRALIAGLLGRDFIFNAGAVVMAPTPGCAPQGLHRDDGFYALIPRPHIPLVITAAIALDDFYPENGSTQLVPGSHLWPTERDPEPQEVSYAEMPAGALLVWDGAMYHGGGANRTNEPRVGLNLTYCLAWLRQQENQYLSCPPHIAKDLDEELQDLLGYTQGTYGLGYYSDPGAPAADFDPLVPELALGRGPRKRVRYNLDQLSDPTSK